MSAHVSTAPFLNKRTAVAVPVSRARVGELVRWLRPASWRRDRLLQGLDTASGVGAELVAPGAAGLLPAGCWAHRAQDVAQLRRGVTAEPFLGLDYVLAPHGVAQASDLVDWLRVLQGLLKPEGRLRLAVPDKRFGADHLRRASGLAEVLHAWQRGARTPGAQCALDFYLHLAEVDTRLAWRGPLEPAMLRRRHDLATALALAEAAERGEAPDQDQAVRCWAFTPASLAGLLAELARQRLVALACEHFHDTEVNQQEFFVALRRCDDASLCAASWEGMAARARVHRHAG